jgi:membrane-associated phospholipid phosphatase
VALTKEKIAHIISNIAQAPLLAIPTFVLINYFSLSFDRFLMTTVICILFAGVLPILVVGLWSKNKGSEKDLPRKEERIVPLLIVIALYLVGAVVLYLSSAPLLATILMFCYFSNTLIVFVINIFWKISIHSMGVSGPTTALIFAFGLPGALPALILPFVMWSRVYLKRHTRGQVFMGALLGFILTATQIYVICRL